MTFLLAPHPFGAQITAEDLKQKFAAFTQWEDRYRQLIMLGKQLPPLPDELKIAEIELSGCENRVWLGYQQRSDGRLHFYGDSEGRIVRGLLAVLLTAVEGQPPAALLRQDPLALFDDLGLRHQLSASRSAGLVALAEAVINAARETR
ncbi:cysteine desulfurase sulfur acceptor subunit CsdE [Erwinia endophytica]|uniref:cysteine desulfurase sulfur acceptor subunit CsdE n=1 Tax=Erwinia endophytica TaxID=1563158 RepID=UPI001265DBDC|nr:cysteine desulfurase sulfur acceptor subunit CsdE [Erwinia endophytica]KAB8305273.1 cysteine desulfurase sulfur acceptor subunit CsdE [Erwinia endophytica]